MITKLLMTVPPPTIRARITFLTEEEGGRRSRLELRPEYMPHIVVGDLRRRRAVLDAAGNGLEDYLGIGIVDDFGPAIPGKPYKVVMSLIHHPRVDYGALIEGSTFTIREGGTIIEYGEVLQGIGRI